MKFVSDRSLVGFGQAWSPRVLDAAAVVVGARRRLEDEDVAALGVAEAEADAVDQHALADLEGRHHRLARDPERLDEERLDAEREAERDRDDRDQLDERAAQRCFCLRATDAVSRARAGVALARGARPLAGASSAGGSSASAVSSGAASARRRPARQASGSAAAAPPRPAASLCGAAASAARRRPASSAASASASSAASTRASSSSPGRRRRPRRRHRALDDASAPRRPRPAALAHPGAAADAVAQVVELRAAHVAAAGHLDLLDLRRMQRERALHADAEGLLADGERLAGAAALALDHDALEDLGPAARALDDLEVDAHAVARLEGGHAAQLGALDAVDDAAHERRGRDGSRGRSRGREW